MFITEAAEGLLLYPNPSNGQFNINTTGLSGDVKVEVYTLEGKMVYNQTFTQGASLLTVSLSEVSKGDYLVKVTDRNGSKTQVVQKN